jgi:hypothetical protein
MECSATIDRILITSNITIFLSNALILEIDLEQFWTSFSALHTSYKWVVEIVSKKPLGRLHLKAE